MDFGKVLEFSYNETPQECEAEVRSRDAREGRGVFIAPGSAGAQSEREREAGL
jgi:hypothetical protein